MLHGLLSRGLITGAGGKEAALFTAEVFHMYQNYSAFRRWEFEVLSVDTSDGGGYRVSEVGREEKTRARTHTHTHTHTHARTHTHTTHTHTMKRKKISKLFLK